MATLLMDTEGLFSFGRNEEFDLQLFAITCLLSNIMMYNIFGAIDEQ